MAGIITSRSRLCAGTTGHRNLRLVASDCGSPLAIAGTSEQSPKTAVMACLTARSSRSNELLRRASAAAREDNGEFYALMVNSRTRFGKVELRSLVNDAVFASHLGAKMLWLDSPDVVGSLLRLAHQLRVGRIFVVRNRPSPLSSAVWADSLFRSVEPRQGYSHRRCRV